MARYRIRLDIMSGDYIVERRKNLGAGISTWLQVSLHKDWESARSALDDLLKE